MLLFFFNDTATTEIYTLSLHDALPIWEEGVEDFAAHHPAHLRFRHPAVERVGDDDVDVVDARVGEQLQHHLRSEEHTSELQLRQYLVCRLLLEKKKQYLIYHI